MVYSSLENAVVWGEVCFRVKKGHGGKKLPDYRKYRRPGDLPFTPAVLSGSEGLKPFEFRRQLVECRLGADLVRTADTAAAVWKRTGKACRRHGTEEVFLLSPEAILSSVDRMSALLDRRSRIMSCACPRA